MNWLAIFLVAILNIRSEEGPIKIQKVCLLENNFWCGQQNQLKTFKKYLYRVSFDLECKNDYIIGFNYYSKVCFSLKSTNLGYLVLKYKMMKYMEAFLKSPGVDKLEFIFRFLFADEPIDSPCYFEVYNGKIRSYITCKFSEKDSENSIKLKNNDLNDFRMEYVKERFERLLSMKMLKFNIYIKIIGEEKLSNIENDADFNLFYFKNYSECFENLKKFIKNFCYFKLLEDNVPQSSTDKSSDDLSFDKIISLNVSQFKKLLDEKINENFKKQNDSEIDEIWQVLFGRCFKYLKNEMLNNNILFPIGGKYDIDFYIVQLSKIIYESVKQKQEKFNNVIPQFNSLTWYKIINLFKLNLEKLQLSVVEGLCESEYIHKHFSELFVNKVETIDEYNDIEKMVCDYHNMFVYIVNLYYKFNNYSKISHSYFPSTFIDNYSLRIIEGIEIDFDWPAKFGYIIRGFDDKKEEIIMVRDTDYFINEFGILYCPSEVLKMKKIHEIEVISFNDKKNHKRFNVNEYVSV